MLQREVVYRDTPIAYQTAVSGVVSLIRNNAAPALRLVVENFRVSERQGLISSWKVLRRQLRRDHGKK